MTAEKGASKTVASGKKAKPVPAIIAEFPLRPYDTLEEESKKPLYWVADQLFMGGEVNLISAPPKAGKSTMARTLCRCITLGESFLDRKVRQGPMLYISLENSLVETLKQLSAAGMEFGKGHDLHIITNVPGGIEENAVWLEQTLQYYPPMRMVLIDTLGAFAPGLDLNDYTAVNAYLQRFCFLMKQYPHTTLVFLHHDRKTRLNEEKFSPERSLGSVGIFGKVYTLVGIDMNYRTFKRTIYSWQRGGEYISPTALLMHPKTGMHMLAGESRQRKVDDDARIAQILERIKSLKEAGHSIRGWVTARQIREGLRNAPKLNRVIYDMHQTGLLLRQGHGFTNDPYFYARPDEESDPPSKKETARYCAHAPRVRKKRSRKASGSEQDSGGESAGRDS